MGEAVSLPATGNAGKYEVYVREGMYVNPDPVIPLANSFKQRKTRGGGLTTYLLSFHVFYVRVTHI
jgi:hypothetical protein